MHENLRGTVNADDGMLQSPVLQGNLDHFAARLFHRFLHGNRHLARLALAHTDAPVTIANHGQGRKTQDPPTLDDLGDAIDGDHLFAQTVIAPIGASLHFLHSCHSYST